MGVIRIRQNGPYLVELAEDVKVVDWNGDEYEISRHPIALCRCGESARKPFCDGAHAKIGFQASEAAVPRGDKPVV